MLALSLRICSNNVLTANYNPFETEKWKRAFNGILVLVLDQNFWWWLKTNGRILILESQKIWLL